jgi:hypothetical protein
MIGYPTNKKDIEKEIKYQESIYRALAVVPETAKSVYQHIEQLKAQLKELEAKETPKK